MMLEEYCSEIISALKRAPRMGAEKDRPEGARYIQMSDTLAKEIADKLSSYLKIEEIATTSSASRNDKE
jgi:hypothetical protein